MQFGQLKCEDFYYKKDIEKQETQVSFEMHPNEKSKKTQDKRGRFYLLLSCVKISDTQRK